MATVARMSKAGVAVAQPYRGRSRAVRPRSYTATVPRGSGGRAARLAVRRRVTGAEGEGQGSTNKTTAGGEEEEEKEEEGEDEKEAADLEAEFEERAQEYARIQQRAQALYSMGKRAYEGGAYKNAVTALEEAVESLANLNDSGECGLWLALSYEACRRDDDALQLYLRLEGHPIPSIRKQATDLRYIFEAPKLKIGDDERVSIPDLSDADALAEKRQRMTRRTQKKVELTLEERVLRDYVPPIRLPNKYIQAASLLLILGLAWYSAYIQRSM